MSISQKPSASASSSTTPPPTPPPLSARRLPRRPRSAPRAPGGSTSTTRPSTPAGSTWLRARSACSKANVSIAESKAPTGWLPRSTSGSLSEIKAALESTGCSPPTRPEPKWRAPIPIPRSKSHNHCAEELAQSSLTGKREGSDPIPTFKSLAGYILLSIRRIALRTAKLRPKRMIFTGPTGAQSVGDTQSRSARAWKGPVGSSTPKRNSSREQSLDTALQLLSGASL